jgi:hypothetical protein
MHRTVLLGCCALALCSSAFAAPIKNTCDLLTKAEVESILGVPMRPPEVQIFHMCEYTSVGDHPYKAVHLVLETVESREDWEKHERTIDPGTPIRVPGIADEALLWNRVLDGRMALIKGKSALSLVIDVGKMMPKVPDTLPVAKRLADIAVPRMP